LCARSIGGWCLWVKAIYRDKKEVVGVFVRFLRAPLHQHNFFTVWQIPDQFNNDGYKLAKKIDEYLPRRGFNQISACDQSYVSSRNGFMDQRCAGYNYMKYLLRR
jgi:hypothetical protein